MKKGNWACTTLLVFLLLNGALLIACGEAEQVPTVTTSPVQQVIPEADRAATPATPGSPTPIAHSAATPSPTVVQAKPSPTATIRPAPVKVPGASPGEAIITVTGQVWEVASSARVIDLVEPVHGINAVAVEDQTEITSADGKRLGLDDIKAGMVIQASGQADGNGAVLANKIRIMTDASPLPAVRPTPD